MLPSNEEVAHEKGTPIGGCRRPPVRKTIRLFRNWVLALISVQLAGSLAADAEETKAMPHMITQQLMVRVPDLAKGRKLFAEKACVLCHTVNGIGGTDAAPLDAALMVDMTDPFDFVANMWRGAPDMLKLQNDELGTQVEFTGEELGDIIGFLHGEEEQKKFSTEDIPPPVQAALSKMESGSPEDRKPGSMNQDMTKDLPGSGASQ